MAKILTNPKPSELEAAAKAGRPMLRVPDVGETVTVDRIEMLVGGARRKVSAGPWKVLGYGGNGTPTMTLEAITRMDIMRQAKARRSWTERLYLTVILAAGLGCAVGIAMGGLIAWVLG